MKSAEERAGGLRVATPFLIEQDYTGYGPEQHELWRELVARRMAQLEQCACREYLEGWHTLGLAAGQIPRLEEVSHRLEAASGWQIQPVSGFLPAEAFFEMLAARRFPTTTWLRSRHQMDYIPEPDILHDALGHLPMLAEERFADAVAEYGRVCCAFEDPRALERMGRLFWYTFEFGLIRQEGEVRVYGSGVASSQQECTNVYSGGCRVEDFSVEAVLETPVKVDEVHRKLFAIRDFDEALEAVNTAREQLRRESA